MDMSDNTSELTADLIIHAANLASGSHRAPSLSAAQWAALRFFARANDFSRTPSAFASYHGTTRGTASQTVKSLVQKGYLRREHSTADGRRKELHLTTEGEQALMGDPADALVRAIDMLPPAKRRALEDVMRRITAHVDTQCGEPTFGVCADCGYRDDRGSQGAVCRVTGEPVGRSDAQQLCYAFTPDSALPDTQV
ncbi:MarR family transcriptional regulator [Aquisalimonas sp. 2447]|nr:MarR family transcriptional regulator [Aquisalimonas sp. 2447]